MSHWFYRFIFIFVFQSQFYTLSAIADSNKVVHIEKYADFECPYGKRVHPMIMKALKKYENKVSFTFKTMPLDYHPTSRIAARHFYALKDQSEDLAFKFYDYVYTNQNQLKSFGQNENYFAKVLDAIGADKERHRKSLTSHTIEQRIDRDIAQAVALKINETPGLVINGRVVPGGIEPSWEQIDQAIMKAIKEHSNPSIGMVE